MSESLAQQFDRLADALLQQPGVSRGAGRKKFGSSAVYFDTKIMAMLTAKNQFVVKLDALTVAQKVAAGQGEYFENGPGRKMKQWLVVLAQDFHAWQDYAHQALIYAQANQN